MRFCFGERIEIAVKRFSGFTGCQVCSHVLEFMYSFSHNAAKKGAMNTAIGFYFHNDLMFNNYFI